MIVMRARYMSLSTAASACEANENSVWTIRIPSVVACTPSQPGIAARHSRAIEPPAMIRIRLTMVKRFSTGYLFRQTVSLARVNVREHSRLERAHLGRYVRHPPERGGIVRAAR